MRGRNIAVAATLTAAALGVGCTSGGERSAERDPTTTSAPEDGTTTEAQINERVNELVTSGLSRVRANFAEHRKLKIVKGLCVGWETDGGRYAVSVNPGFYLRETPDERFSFIVFSSQFGLREPSPRSDQLTVLNGPFEYSQKDEAGQMVVGTHYGQEFDMFPLNPSQSSAGLYYGKIDTTPVTVKPDMTQLDDGSWTLQDQATDEPVLLTRIFEGKSKADLAQLCPAVLNGETVGMTA